jgi:ribosomal protein RSM22 (predicted rRNA methylase)
VNHRTPGDIAAADHLVRVDSFKIQAHAMFLDTSFSSLHTVLSNVYNAFTETATKLWTYARCLPVGKQPGTKLMISKSTWPLLIRVHLSPYIIETINDLIELAFVLMKSKGRNKKNAGYKCGLSKLQVEW